MKTTNLMTPPPFDLTRRIRSFFSHRLGALLLGLALLLGFTSQAQAQGGGSPNEGVTSLVATQQPGQVTLTWEAPVDTTRLVGYYIVRNEDTSVTGFAAPGSKVLESFIRDSSLLTYTDDDDVEPGSSYIYFVVVRNEGDFIRGTSIIVQVNQAASPLTLPQEDAVVFAQPRSPQHVIPTSIDMRLASGGTEPYTYSAFSLDAGGAETALPTDPLGTTSSGERLVVNFTGGNPPQLYVSIAAIGTRTYTYRVTDAAGATADTTFTVEAIANTGLDIFVRTLPLATTPPLPGDLTFVLGQAITPITFPGLVDTAISARLRKSYTMSLSLTGDTFREFIPGLFFGFNEPVLSGTPTTLGTHTVTYQIRAGTLVGGAGYGSTALDFTINIVATAPTAPVLSSFAATVTGLEVALSWDVNQGGSDITSYTLTRALGTATPVAITAPAIGVTTLTDTVPAAGVYTYSLIATNGVGPSVAAPTTATASTLTLPQEDAIVFAQPNSPHHVIPVPIFLLLASGGTEPYTYSAFSLDAGAVETALPTDPLATTSSGERLVVNLAGGNPPVLHVSVAAIGTRTYTYRVTDADSATADTTFTVETIANLGLDVLERILPLAATPPLPGDLTFVVGQAITPITFPGFVDTAISARLRKSYTMSLDILADNFREFIPGLFFGFSEPVLSGTPTAIGTHTVTYQAEAGAGTGGAYSLETLIEFTINIVATAPTAPVLSNFAATVTGLEVALSWDVNQGGSDITSYTLTRALGTATPVAITAPAIGVTTLTDTVPAAGVYTYSLIATNGVGPSVAAPTTATASTLTLPQEDAIVFAQPGSPLTNIPVGISMRLASGGTTPYTYSAFSVDAGGAETALPTAGFTERLIVNSASGNSPSLYVSLAAIGTRTYTYRVTDAASATAETTFTVETIANPGLDVFARSLPLAATPPLPGDLTFVVGQAITPITFPGLADTAISARLRKSYSMSLDRTADIFREFIPGLFFGFNEPVLSGTPTTIGTHAVTYQVDAGIGDASYNLLTAIEFTINIVAATVPTLSSFAAVPTDFEIALTWDVDNEGSDITGYTLTRASGSDPAETITPAPAIGVTTFTDTAPAIGNYTYTLIATNAGGGSTPAEITVIAGPNAPPTAASSTLTYQPFSTLSIDFKTLGVDDLTASTDLVFRVHPLESGDSRADAFDSIVGNGDGVTRAQDVNNAAVTSADKVVTLPDTAGAAKTQYLRYSVSDGVNPAVFGVLTLTLTAPSTTNPPTATAGSDVTGIRNMSVALTGSGMATAAGATITHYSWQQIDGVAPFQVALGTGNTPRAITGTTTATATDLTDSFFVSGFFFPDGYTDGPVTLTFSLTVWDSRGAKSTNAATVTAVITPPNNAPVAMAGDDQSVIEGATVTIIGSGSDAEGEALTYVWEQTGSPSADEMVDISASFQTATLTFTAPMVATTTILTFGLTVSDSDTTSADSAEVLVEITVHNALAFASTPPVNIPFVTATTISPVTLPAATGGIGELSYALAPLPAGVSFDPATRILSGTSTTVGMVMMVYSVTDSATPTANSITRDIIAATTAAPLPLHFRDDEGVMIAADGMHEVGFTINREGSDVLPLGSGGTLAAGESITYALTPAAGNSRTLSADAFNETTREFTDTFTTAGTFAYNYVATAGSESVSLTFNVEVNAALGLTLPSVTYTYATGTPVPGSDTGSGGNTIDPGFGGTAPFVFSLTNLPTGVSFDADTRVISGTPTDGVDTMGVFTVTDRWGATATQTSIFTVQTPTVFSAGEDRTVPVNSAVMLDGILTRDPDDSADVSYAWTLVTTSVTLDSGTTVTPSAGIANSTSINAIYPAAAELPGGVILTFRLTYTAGTGADAVTDSDDVVITYVTAPIVPVIADVTWTIRAAAYSITLPESTSGGEGTIRNYALLTASDTAVTGFNPTSRIFTFTATTAGTTTYTYRVSDEATPPKTGEGSFMVTIVAAPTFDSTPLNLTFTQNSAITATTFPEATQGSPELTYQLTSTLLPGLAFAADTRILSGTPTTAAARATLIYTATDANGVSATSRNVSILVNPGLDFASEPPATLTFPRATAITPITLPAGRNGEMPHLYTLIPRPSGLDFDTDTRVLSGTPATLETVTAVYTLMDSASPAVVLTRNIVINIQGLDPTPAIAMPTTPLAEGATLTLDGSGSMGDEDAAIDYQWAITGISQAGAALSVDLVTLATDDAAMLTFPAPNFSKSTNLTFELVVTAIDGGAMSPPASETIEVAGMNDEPTADATMTAANVPDGTQFRFDGTASDDADIDDALTYRWVVTYSASAETTTTVTLTGATPTFTPPNYSEDTDLTAVLTVTDLADATDTTTVTITVDGMPNAPTANAGEDRGVPIGEAITLDGRDSEDLDVDQDLSYSWTLTDTPAVTIGMTEISLVSANIVDDTAAMTTFPTTYLADGSPATMSTPETTETFDLPSGTLLTFELRVGEDPDSITAIPADATAAHMQVDTVVYTIQSGADEATDEAVLSEVARAIVSSTLNAITNRISNAASNNSGGLQIAGLNLHNNSNDSADGMVNHMASAVRTHGEALATNSAAAKTILGDTTFQLPLNAVSDGNGGGIAFWGGGEYSAISGQSDGLDWDGELSGFHLGIDGKIHTASSNDFLIGVAVSSLASEVDYTDADDNKGNYEIDMASISPYIGWRAGKVNLWASVGFGNGEVEHKPEDGDKNSRDAKQSSYAFGGTTALLANQFIDKNFSLNLKGELSSAVLELDGSTDNGGVNDTELNATRMRFSIEANQSNSLSGGNQLISSAELGARFDGGDGETGSGIELGGKLKYTNQSGFIAEGSARVLLGHSGDNEEWGIQGTLRKQVGRDGQGFSFHLTPAYGDINSGVQQLLDQGLNYDANNDVNATTDPDYHMNLTTRLGYGIAYRGMLTPYTEMVLGTIDEYRMGINWKPNKVFNLTLLGEKTQSTINENAVKLKAQVNF